MVTARHCIAEGCAGPAHLSSLSSPSMSARSGATERFLPSSPIARWLHPPAAGRGPWAFLARAAGAPPPFSGRRVKGCERRCTRKHSTPCQNRSGDAGRCLTGRVAESPSALPDCLAATDVPVRPLLFRLAFSRVRQSAEGREPRRSELLSAGSRRRRSVRVVSWAARPGKRAAVMLGMGGRCGCVHAPRPKPAEGERRRCTGVSHVDCCRSCCAEACSLSAQRRPMLAAVKQEPSPAPDGASSACRMPRILSHIVFVAVGSVARVSLRRTCEDPVPAARTRGGTAASPLPRTRRR